MTAARITPEAAAVMREAIVEVGGMEVFAIGDVDGGVVVTLTIAARGREDQVNALRERPRARQVVLHNHPSGDLRPSEADMRLAGMYGENGVGFAIVDNQVTRAHWVVEPWDKPARTIGTEAVDRFFTTQLAAAIPGWEPRQAQLDMARKVMTALDEGHPLLVEAGTGTGKSLAYLVPAALWAKANDAKVVIATHTRTLQGQILDSDVPMLKKAGLDVVAAALEGRGNYVCKRRLGLAKDEPVLFDDDRAADWRALLGWAESTATGSRLELPLRVHPELWERIESDSDLTLRHRCPLFQECFYYNARRNVAAAHLIIANHALLLTDLAIKAEGGTGILPKYDRLILDEAQHLEDVATGALGTRVTRMAVRRALFGLPSDARRNRKGAFERLGIALDAARDLPRPVVSAVRDRLADAQAAVERLPTAIDAVFFQLANVVDPKAPQRRVDAAWTASEEWQVVVSPQLHHLMGVLDTLSGQIGEVSLALGDHQLPEGQVQPFLDLERARKKLLSHANALRTFLGADGDRCRWLELARERDGNPTAAVFTAPVKVAETLQRLLWEAIPGVVGTSATLSVAGDFKFWLDRAGLAEADTATFPSPFNHFEQALLGLPRDLPSPDQPGFDEAASRIVAEAVAIAGGGAFVLCTSFKAVTTFAAAIRRALPHLLVLAQGEAGRQVLLDRFREHHDAVLVGTDSFWEGVSVKGDGLRLVIIPKMPFRVPTEPLQQARHERIARDGGDPFRQLTLPQAVLKLRQGYGRLIRSTTDKGVVLLLDRRVIEKAYGRVVLAALPPARRLSAEWARIAEEMRQFYRYRGR